MELFIIIIVYHCWFENDILPCGTFWPLKHHLFVHGCTLLTTEKKQDNIGMCDVQYLRQETHLGYATRTLSDCNI